MTAPETLRLAPNGWVPNSSLPVLIYRGVVPVGDPGSIEAILRANRWRADWRDGVYPYHHYHSTAHEALACTGGTEKLILGGEGGTVATISAGDFLVLPAGTGHRRVRARVSCSSVLIAKARNGTSVAKRRTPGPWSGLPQCRFQKLILSAAGKAT